MSSAAVGLVALARDLYLRGLSPGTTGNLSVQLERDLIAITPTNSCLGYLDPDALARLDPSDGRFIDGPAPSKEAPLHLGFYDDPTVGAVVHLHSPWATAASCLRQDIRAELARFTPYFSMKVGRLALIPYAPPGSQAVQAALRGHLDGCKAAMLRNHGTITAAKTPVEAADMAEQIEEAARLWFVTRGHALELLPADDRT